MYIFKINSVCYGMIGDKIVQIKEVAGKCSAGEFVKIQCKCTGGQ